MMDSEEVSKKIKYLIDRASKLEKKLNQNVLNSKLNIEEDSN